MFSIVAHAELSCHFKLDNHVILLRYVCGLHYQILGAEISLNPRCTVKTSAWKHWHSEIFPPVWVLKKELLLIPFWLGLAMTNRLPSTANPAKSIGTNCRTKVKIACSKDFGLSYFQKARIASGKGGKYKIGVIGYPYRQCSPVAHNAGEFWGRNSFVKRAGKITVSIGKPIDQPAWKEFECANRKLIEAETQRISTAINHGRRPI
jgi:1-acyl-sn-glycerol-3-phosphate acyltransferase